MSIQLSNRGTQVPSFSEDELDAAGILSTKIEAPAPSEAQPTTLPTGSLKSQVRHLLLAGKTAATEIAESIYPNFQELEFEVLVRKVKGAIGNIRTEARKHGDTVPEVTKAPNPEKTPEIPKPSERGVDRTFAASQQGYRKKRTANAYKGTSPLCLETRARRAAGVEDPTDTPAGNPVLSSILAASPTELAKNHKDFYDVNFIGKTFPFVANRLIRLFSEPGDPVYDCMLGSGTTLYEAAKLGRRVQGSDINPDQVSSFIERWEKFPVEGWDSHPPVRQAPAQKLGHVPDNSQQLVIMSYPWLNNWYFGNSDEAHALDIQGNYHKFIQLSVDIYKEVFRILRPGGYVCNILGDGYNHGLVFPLTADIIETGRRMGYMFHYIFFASRVAPEFLFAPWYRSAMTSAQARADNAYPWCVHEEIPVLRKPLVPHDADRSYLDQLKY